MVRGRAPLRKRTLAVTTCDARRFRIGSDALTDRCPARTVTVRTCRPLIEKAMSRICRPATVTCTTLVGHAECAPSLAIRAGAFTSSSATALAGAGGGAGAGAGATAAAGAGGGAAGVVQVIDCIAVPLSPVENWAETDTVNGPVGAVYGTVSVPLTGLVGTTKLLFTADTPLTVIS
jgi:hypothetical protein